jgi:hypothetical protein
VQLRKLVVQLKRQGCHVLDMDRAQLPLAHQGEDFLPGCRI